MKLEYEKNGDYYIPRLMLDPEPEGDIGMYGLKRKKFLKEHFGGTYSALLLEGKLKQHLLDIQERAEKEEEKIVKSFAKMNRVTETMKEADQMLWVSKMEKIRANAVKIVLNEIVYRL